MVCTHAEPVLPAQCVIPGVQSGQPCPIPGPSGLMHESTCSESRGVLQWSMPVALMEVRVGVCCCGPCLLLSWK